MARCIPIIVLQALWAEEADRAVRHPKGEDHSPALKSDPISMAECLLSMARASNCLCVYVGGGDVLIE